MAKHATDPVCGMTVDPARAAASVEHEGKTYSFCSSHCAATFRADPGKFLAGAREGMGDETARPDGKGGSKGDYTPLIVVVGLLVLMTAALGLKDWRAGRLDAAGLVEAFMAGFFLVFAGFKLMDLRGFAEGYSTYDLLARRVPAYGFVYPFIELGFGLGMILFPSSRPLLAAELVVMAFSGLGVAVKLAKRERFQCACLGTFLKVPLTKVTLVEDFGMAALAAALLWLA